MIDWIKDALALSQQVPAAAWAVVLGLPISWSVTQRAKRFLPRSLRGNRRAVATQWMGFGSGFAAAFVVHPTQVGAVVAVAVGLLSPAVWRVMVVLIGRRWPDVRDALSGDTP